MIFKLSLKNLKAHVPNYLVYYISMTFAAVVYIVSVRLLTTSLLSQVQAVISKLSDL